MPKLPVVSGRRMVAVATRLGFEFKRISGSHAVLRNKDRVLVIPLHRALKKGTLHQILRVLGITGSELAELI